MVKVKTYSHGSDQTELPIQSTKTVAEFKLDYPNLAYPNPGDSTTNPNPTPIIGALGAQF